MSNELKACPFCGGKACYVNDDGLGTFMSTSVSCANPNCMPFSSQVPDKSWERRPLEDALTARAEVAEAEIERMRWRKYPDEIPPEDETLEAITDAGTILVLGFCEYWFLADDEDADEIQREVIYWRYWFEPPSNAREDFLSNIKFHISKGGEG